MDEGRPAGPSIPPTVTRQDDGRHREFVPVELYRDHTPTGLRGHEARSVPAPDATFTAAQEPVRGDGVVQHVTLFHDLDR